MAASCAKAQSQELPPGKPADGATPPSNPPPPPVVPVSAEELSARLKALEENNRRLLEQLEKANREHERQISDLLSKMNALSDRVDKSKDEPARRSVGVDAPASTRISERSNADGPPPSGSAPRQGERGTTTPGVGAPANSAETTETDTPVPDYTEGQLNPRTPAPGYPVTERGDRKRLPLGGSFGPGFQFETEDEEYRLRIHYESQIEWRNWARTDQVPANSGIFLPRQRIFFNGNITRPIEYEFSINRGFSTLNILNAYINLHFDDRFELRFGRFFTPLDYDQYAISNYWLPTPERSLFTTNVGLGRQIGMMAWGYLFDKRLDYAAGIFNGSRNSFENMANSYDFVTYINTRPLQESESLPFLKFLNLGTSFAFGHQDQSPVPVSFRIAGGSPNADNPGPGTTPFLILNNGVIERGDRLLGSVHSAYFYKGLSLIGEWQYGYGSYASNTHPVSSQVPFSGYYLAGGYFLTGEHIDRRSRVTPLRPFLPSNKGDQRGPGAWEVVGRVSELSLGREIFSGGFADPNLWSNRATTTELGLNWYWNEYVKIYMFWLHGDFGSPVQYRPGGFQKTADLFWLRFQLYF
jgi:phosphate-selective porin OprO and OprP